MKVYIVEQPCTMLTSQRVVGVYSNKKLAEKAVAKINSKAISILSTVGMEEVILDDPFAAEKFILHSQKTPSSVRGGGMNDKYLDICS